MFPFDCGTHSTYKPRCKVIGNIVNLRASRGVWQSSRNARTFIFCSSWSLPYYAYSKTFIFSLQHPEYHRLNIFLGNSDFLGWTVFKSWTFLKQERFRLSWVSFLYTGRKILETSYQQTRHGQLPNLCQYWNAATQRSREEFYLNILPR